MKKQTRQFNPSTGRHESANASVRLFIFPMLCADGIIRIGAYLIFVMMIVAIQTPIHGNTTIEIGSKNAASLTTPMIIMVV